MLAADACHEVLPTSKNTKKQILEYFNNVGIVVPPKATKNELLERLTTFPEEEATSTIDNIIEPVDDIKEEPVDIVETQTVDNKIQEEIATKEEIAEEEPKPLTDKEEISKFLSAISSSIPTTLAAYTSSYPLLLSCNFQTLSTLLPLKQALAVVSAIKSRYVSPHVHNPPDSKTTIRVSVPWTL
jgi:hypothetical protein